MRDDATREVVATTTTDGDGRFSLALPPGRYYFEDPTRRVSLRGHAFEVRSGQYTSHHIDEPEPGP